MHRDSVTTAGRDGESRNDCAADARFHHRDLRLEVVEHHVRWLAATEALQVAVDELLDRIVGRRTDQAPVDDVLPAQAPRRPARRPRRRLDHHQGEAEERDAAYAADRLKETAQADVDLAGQRHGDDARAVAVVQDYFHAGIVGRVVADYRRQQLARDERRRA